MMTDAEIDALEVRARCAKMATAHDSNWLLIGHVEQQADAVLALSAEVRRLRTLTTPSPAGTVRLLYQDGTPRDVATDDPMPLKDDAGDLVERAPLNDFDWRSWRRRGYQFRVASQWNAPDGSVCQDWATVQIETFEEESARERAARIEALAEVNRLCNDLDAVDERRYASELLSVQHAAAKAAHDTERSIAAWLDEQADAVDPGQPGAREVVAALRRLAAEIGTGA